MERNFFDGRYFNITLENINNIDVNYLLLKKPIHLYIYENNYNMDTINNYLYNKNIPCIIRIIVNFNNIIHSVLLILDHEYEEIIFYDPSKKSNIQLHKIISNILSEKLKFLNYFFNDIQTYELYENNLCNALILKYALIFLQKKEFTEKDLLSIYDFMDDIEKEYECELNGYPDISYGTKPLISDALEPKGKKYGSELGYKLGNKLGKKLENKFGIKNLSEHFEKYGKKYGEQYGGIAAKKFGKLFD